MPVELAELPSSLAYSNTLVSAAASNILPKAASMSSSLVIASGTLMQSETSMLGTASSLILAGTSASHLPSAMNDLSTFSRSADLAMRPSAPKMLSIFLDVTLSCAPSRNNSISSTILSLPALSPEKAPESLPSSPPTSPSDLSVVAMDSPTPCSPSIISFTYAISRSTEPPVKLGTISEMMADASLRAAPSCSIGKTQPIMQPPAPNIALGSAAKALTSLVSELIEVLTDSIEMGAVS
mmetsp:Transcript_12439/g.31485  ORF Transcript_12439/g.31485 Transcript_12439/m.31485 type:complete len:239 (+) Transcript_12439:414-1130(+)